VSKGGVHLGQLQRNICRLPRIVVNEQYAVGAMRRVLAIRSNNRANASDI
jgi:hypothetical protein